KNRLQQTNVCGNTEPTIWLSTDRYVSIDTKEMEI
ncbi:MAG: hypothetical protein ACJAUL_001317, partial [Paraglaciecola sp.]